MEDTHNLVVAVRKYAASLSAPRRGTRLRSEPAVVPRLPYQVPRRVLDE